MDRLDVAIEELDRETSPARIVRTSMAAVYVDRAPGCRAALLRAANDGRDSGAITQRSKRWSCCAVTPGSRVVG
jgi:hypothetical protein